MIFVISRSDCTSADLAQKTGSAFCFPPRWWSGRRVGCFGGFAVIAWQG